MRTHNRLLAIIVLSIFVLAHILPLHNAISDCFVDTSVSYLENAYDNGLERVRLARIALEDKQNNDFLKSWVDTTMVTTITGTAIGTLSALLSMNPIPIVVGSVGGIVTGTVASIQSHYKAIKDARDELEAAEKDLKHIREYLILAKQKEAEAAIQPQESHISVYTPHTIKISTGKPIKNVNVYIAPQDLEDPMSNSSPVFFDTGDFSNNVYNITISHTFSTQDKGTQSIWVTIYLNDETTIPRQYNILVTD